ncbi:MAG: DNA-directed RNA polymerase subunit L [Methanonatronarchaeales archaeon]|nr:DNA-directed RNA polymerase subunit L [Methanonatronarchaeales archaeon]
MDVKVLEVTDTEVKLELRGESHGFPNLLKEALLRDGRTGVASYDIDHPLEGEPVLYLETKGDDPLEVLRETLETIRDEMESAEASI